MPFPTAFTLIELLVVIAIIAILIGLLFAAFKYVRNSADRNATAVAMQNLTGMLSEFDAASHLNRAPVMWNWYQSVSGTPTNNTFTGTFSNAVTIGLSGLTADFWRYPFSTSNNTANPVVWEALDAPGDVRTDSGDQIALQRTASNAILNTQLAMQLLVTLPANQAALGKLPSGQTMYLPFPNSAQLALYLPKPQTDPTAVDTGVLKEDGTDGQLSLTYPQGVHVSYNGDFYVSLKALIASTNVPSPDPNHTSTTWYYETGANRGVPVVLDGWGNPVLFVPASGLHVRLLNGKSSYNVGDRTQDFIIVSPEGVVANNGSSTLSPVVTKPGRPFFASAGPDGDFTKGDDNIYSFEH